VKQVNNLLLYNTGEAGILEYNRHKKTR